MKVRLSLLKLKKFFYNPLVIDILLLGIIFILYNFIFAFYFMEVSLCDSIGSSSVGEQTSNANINIISEDRVSSGINNDEGTGYTVDKASSGLYLKYKLIIRRKLYWLFNGYNSGRYTSYEEFKKAWTPKMSLRKEFRDSFRNMIRDPRGDIARTRERVSWATENARMVDAKSAEEYHLRRMAEAVRDTDRFNKGLRG